MPRGLETLLGAAWVEGRTQLLSHHGASCPLLADLSPLLWVTGA